MFVLTNNLFKTGSRSRKYSRSMFRYFLVVSGGKSFVASLVGVRCSLKDLQESNDL